MIYMIRAGEDGPVKIGFTASDATKRLRGLQTSHSQRLSIIRLFEGDMADEKRLHIMFADLRRSGEWFNFSRAMLGDVGLVEIGSAQSKPEPARATRLVADNPNLVSWAKDVCRHPFPCVDPRCPA
jgi:hypothetical protein